MLPTTASSHQTCQSLKTGQLCYQSLLSHQVELSCCSNFAIQLIASLLLLQKVLTCYSATKTGSYAIELQLPAYTNGTATGSKDQNLVAEACGRGTNLDSTSQRTMVQVCRLGEESDRELRNHRNSRQDHCCRAGVHGAFGDGASASCGCAKDGTCHSQRCLSETQHHDCTTTAAYGHPLLPCQPNVEGAGTRRASTSSGGGDDQGTSRGTAEMAHSLVTCLSAATCFTKQT